MALVYTFQNNTGGSLTLVGKEVRAASVLTDGTLSYTVTATDANGWVKTLTGTVVVASGLPIPPNGSVFLLGVDGAYLEGADGNLLLGAA